jgi:antitoxin component of RelBE/YafQ-DinJ toxin-antitoxin module
VARNRVVCFRVEENVWKRFKRFAHEKRITPSQLLRWMVEIVVTSAEHRGSSEEREDDSAL